MKYSVRIFAETAILLFFFVLPKQGVAHDEGYEPEYSLNWPLIEPAYDSDRNPILTGNPRPALGSTTGEYQGSYLHTGADFRGHAGDFVRPVKDGYIWAVSGIQYIESEDALDCTRPGEYQCKIYVIDNIIFDEANYIYYYSHLNFDTEAVANAPASVREAYRDAYTYEELSVLTDDALENAANYINSTTQISSNSIIAVITAFADSWDHLHFAIIDFKGNYDAINPLTALRNDEATLRDSTPPVIDTLSFREDESPSVEILPTGECNEIGGNSDIDVISLMRDIYQYDSSLPGTDSIGVYEAKYYIKNVGEPAFQQEGTWYRFDRLPIYCAGESRGSDCPEHLTRTQFYRKSLANTYSPAPGSFQAGIGFSQVLYQDWNSSYLNPNSEAFYHVLTNEWGYNGFWSREEYPDGKYQVSIEAFDEAGNGQSKSIFVYLNKDGVYPLVPVEDAYVRDHPEDNGALPSTLGGKPFWTSPDILVLNDVAGLPSMSQPLLKMTSDSLA